MRSFKRVVLDFIVVYGIKVLGVFPLWILRVIGYFCGFIFVFFPTELRHVAYINIVKCLPELSSFQQKKLCFRSVVEVIVTGFEMSKMFTSQPHQLMRYIKTIDLPEALKNFDAHTVRDKPILFLGAHIGCWELASLFLIARFQASNLYRVPKIAVLDRLIRKARERSGGALCPAKREGIKQLFLKLKNNGAVGMLTDQVPGENGGLYVPFFNHIAQTVRLPSKFYHSFKPEVYLLSVIRKGLFSGYHVKIDTFFDIYEHYEMRKKAGEVGYVEYDTFTLAMNHALERIIRRDITQYQWVYKRFKWQPEGMRDIYAKKTNTNK